MTISSINFNYDSIKKENKIQLNSFKLLEIK
jgi:hypothetical protein